MRTIYNDHVTKDYAKTARRYARQGKEFAKRGLAAEPEFYIQRCVKTQRRAENFRKAILVRMGIQF